MEWMVRKTKKGQPLQEKRWQSFSKVASNSVNPEFQSYLDSYLTIAENSGVDLSYIYNYPVKIQFDNLPKDSKGSGDYLGFALGKDDDELVHIVIDYQYWSSMNDLQKTQLLKHLRN